VTSDGSRTYWHVVGPGWREGDPLLSYWTLQTRGEPPPWKWDGDPFTHGDPDVVCLFEHLHEAEEMIAEYGGRLLRVDLPPEKVGSLLHVEEGYPAAFQIDPQYITVCG